ncbi:MAG: iduronate-2-sulfatase [Armatimonadetes bacterium CG_4_10_14_3_um_filter_66_18]|nr:MAG: iduronate-2-sulfatase [Armatimonadetes bacterium CG06_land_8_20_14_3_00_66_21]PIY51095.1 MAG: iduronate-2-sulfatase [Armatimonadetes bacterium CG_4_10_14_3_um_filter_66_18]
MSAQLTRRDFLSVGSAIGAGLLVGKSRSVRADDRPNVLFLAVDDLNHWVGYTGRNPQAKTPNMDRLSRRGTSFTHGYCAAPLCNPSRAALMSGLRPGATGCYQNPDNWKQYVPEGIGLAATFKQAGYYVAGAGKIYHGSTYYPGEWDDYFDERGFGSEDDEQVGERVKGIGKLEGFHTPVTHDLKDSDLSDYRIVDYCIQQLGKQHDKPFFLACGVHKPHLPWVVPRKYYDMFPEETIQLPPYKEDDLDDIPPAGIRMAKPEGDHKQILGTGRWKAAIQSYLAAGAYTDMNVGRLLDALEKSPYAKNTIICFWGDHGWHLGEKHHWRKFTLWEEATRAPFIWVVPGLTKPNTICARTVDFMCIYPTLCGLAGIPVPKHVDGADLRKLLADPTAPWDAPAVTTFGYMNHTVRTDSWRYLRYANGDEELYDEKGDPYEWTNRSSSADMESQKAALAKSLPTQNTPVRAKRVRGARKAAPAKGKRK